MTETISVLCNFCGKNDSELLYKVQECTGLFSETFDLVHCRHCGLAYVNPRPVNKELRKYYPQDSYYAYRNNSSETLLKSKIKNYLAEWAGGYRTDAINSRSSWRLSLSKILRLITRNVLIGIVPYKKDGKMLDVGSGNGDFLAWHKHHGWDVYGVEINEEASMICWEKGIKIFNGSLQDARFENNFFDVVTLVQVLEHMPSPSEVIKEIDRILKPDGLLLIGVPNFGCFDRKVFEKNWIPLEVPRHLYHFDLQLLINLLASYGFVIQDVKAKGFYLFGLKNLLRVFYKINFRKFLRILFLLAVLKPLIFFSTRKRKERFATFVSVYCTKNNEKLI